MMSNWQIKKLDELCHIARGGSPRPIKEFITDDPDGINWIKISDATASSKYIYETKQKIKPEGVSRSRLVHNGDFLLSNSMSFGRPYIMRTSGCIHDGWLVLGDISETLDHDYLYYFLGSHAAYQQFDDRASGSTVRNLNIDLVRSVKIILPPFEVQKRIVAILDEAFAGIDTAIANTKKNLANARELFESYLNSIFTKQDEGWEQKTLKQVCIDFGRGKSKHRPRNDPKLYDGSYPFIQTGDVRDCEHLIKESKQTYNEVGLAQSKLWPKGTICITIAANIAETGILQFDACFPDSIIGMVVDDNQTSNDYVEYLLQSVKARIKAKGKGSAQDNINLATFENEFFPFPDLNIQSEFVKNLHELSISIQRLELIYQQKLNSLTELKQSLLQKAFSGELTIEADKLKDEAAA